MLTPKFRKSPAAERIRRLLHTCVGSLKIPRKGGRHVLSPASKFMRRFPALMKRTGSPMGDPVLLSFRPGSAQGTLGIGPAHCADKLGFRRFSFRERMVLVMTMRSQ